jgi:hypothetical protein
MNTDFKSLERRYGTLLALKIYEEIGRAEQRHFNFYKIPAKLRAIHYGLMDEDARFESPLKRLA